MAITNLLRGIGMDWEPRASELVGSVPDISKGFVIRFKYQVTRAALS